MNSNVRNFIIWVFIGLLLVALFNLFQTPGVQVRGNEISFSQLLSEVEGYSGPEIAERVGLSGGAVRTRLSRLRAELREQFGRSSDPSRNTSLR